MEPVGVRHIAPFPIHIVMLRRFASADLNVTEQLSVAVRQDHPDNIVQKIVGHKHEQQVLWCRV